MVPAHHILWKLWLLGPRLGTGCTKDEKKEAMLLALFYKGKIHELINSWPYKGVVHLQVGSSCYSELVNVHTPSLSYCCRLSSAGSSRLLSLLESKQTSHLYEI